METTNSIREIVVGEVAFIDHFVEKKLRDIRLAADKKAKLGIWA